MQRPPAVGSRVRFAGNRHWPACTGVVRSVNPTHRFEGDPDWGGDIGPLPVATNDEPLWLVVIEADAPSSLLARFWRRLTWLRAEDGKHYIVPTVAEVEPLQVLKTSP